MTIGFINSLWTIPLFPTVFERITSPYIGLLYWFLGGALCAVVGLFQEVTLSHHITHTDIIWE